MQFIQHRRCSSLPLFALSILLLTAGCTGRPDKSPIRVESATNWLQACDSDAMCQAGSSCLTGICSLPCEPSVELETTDRCAAISPNAECVLNGAETGRCDQACIAPADCSVIGTQYDCVDGHCRKNASDRLSEAGTALDISGVYAFRVVTTQVMTAIDMGLDPAEPDQVVTETSFGVSTVTRQAGGGFLANEALCHSRQGDTLAHLDVIGTWSPEVLRSMSVVSRRLSVEPHGVVYGSPAKRVFALEEGLEGLPEMPGEAGIADPDRDGRPGLAIRWQPSDGGEVCESDLIGYSIGSYANGTLTGAGTLRSITLEVQRQEFQLLPSSVARCAFPPPPSMTPTHEVTFSVMAATADSPAPPSCPPLDEMMALF